MFFSSRDSPWICPRGAVNVAGKDGSLENSGFGRAFGNRFLLKCRLHPRLRQSSQLQRFWLVETTPLCLQRVKNKLKAAHFKFADKNINDVTSCMISTLFKCKLLVRFWKRSAMFTPSRIKKNKPGSFGFVNLIKISRIQNNNPVSPAEMITDWDIWSQLWPIYMFLGKNCR